MTELYPLIEPYDQGLLDVGDGSDLKRTWMLETLAKFASR